MCGGAISAGVDKTWVSLILCLWIRSGEEFKLRSRPWGKLSLEVAVEIRGHSVGGIGSTGSGTEVETVTATGTGSESGSETGTGSTTGSSP